MNGINLYITVSAITLGILSALLNFTGRQKYKDNASFFESANNELREQNMAYRAENTELKTVLAEAQATVTSQNNTIEQLKPFSEVVTTMSNNHREVMKSIAGVTKLIAGKINGDN